MSGAVARELKQTARFASVEQEVLLGLRVAASRALDPWARFLTTTAGVRPPQPQPAPTSPRPLRVCIRYRPQRFQVGFDRIRDGAAFESELETGGRSRGADRPEGVLQLRRRAPRALGGR